MRMGKSISTWQSLCVEVDVLNVHLMGMENILICLVSYTESNLFMNFIHRPTGSSASTHPYVAGLDLLWSFTMRCCTYEQYKPPSTADKCLQLHPRAVRYEVTEDMCPDLCMDASCHLRKSWNHQDVAITLRWGHLPLLGPFLKGRMTGLLQSLHSSSLALLLILILLSWNPCTAKDLHC